MPLSWLLITLFAEFSCSIANEAAPWTNESLGLPLENPPAGMSTLAPSNTIFVKSVFDGHDTVTLRCSVAWELSLIVAMIMYLVPSGKIFCCETESTETGVIGPDAILLSWLLITLFAEFSCSIANEAAPWTNESIGLPVENSPGELEPLLLPGEEDVSVPGEDVPPDQGEEDVSVPDEGEDGAPLVSIPVLHPEGHGPLLGELLNW